MGSHQPIRRVSVLGAGTMGAQLAAHLVNAGLDVSLFDVRRDLAEAAVRKLAAIKPDPLFRAGTGGRIRTGAFDDLASLREADWIVEAILESPEPKRRLLEAVDALRAPGSIVSTNTSGLSIGSLAEGRSADFRRHWLGTHFFNPPRYMHLVEVIPTPETDPAVADGLADFLDRRLGKGVVLARDTPAFIANRIGVHGVMQMLAVLGTGAFTIEEIDAITGAIIGRPKSATFRTADLAGLDILSAVATDLATRLPDADERAAFVVPSFVTEMIHRGLLGEKTGQGFYKRTRTATGETQILTLDLSTFEYRPSAAPKLPELDEAARISNLDERLRSLFHGTHRTGDLLRRAITPTITYAARIAKDVAHSIDDVDRAMRWGFGWERGPFELADAVGDDKRWREGALPPAKPGMFALQVAKATRPVVAKNAAASLVDLGDGVLAVEFHSKMNTIGGDTIAMIREGLTRAARDFAALVIGHETEPFSAGANLALILMEAQDGNWDEVDSMVRTFQATTSAIKYSAVPVVVAPAGLAIGGACEISLHADRLQAAAETYIGLVEVGVGLIPAGGGTKEMIVRAGTRAGGGTLHNVLRETFETIGFGKVSTSADDARRLGFLRDVDIVSMNRDRLIGDAKALALARVAEGYAPPAQADAMIPVAGADVRAVLDLGVHLAHRAARISDHDATIGRLLSKILTGGDVPHRTTVSEAYLLDLEREAFLSLCGEPKTLDRIRFTLKTGKTLRN